MPSKKPPKAGERYRHYKGGVYVIVGTAQLANPPAGKSGHAIVYHPEGKPEELWVRSIEDWCSRAQGWTERFVRVVQSD